MSEARYPDAIRENLIEESHGHHVRDPYRWLEDADSTATKEWARAQDALFAETARGWPATRWFGDQVQSLLRAGYVGTPVWRGEQHLFTRRSAEQEHGVLYHVDAGGTERVLIDPTELAPDGTTTLDSWRPDRDGRLLAYQLSEGGNEQSMLRVMDVASGTVVDGPIDRCSYSPIAWLAGEDAFYYVRRLAPGSVPEGEEQYHRRVYLHRVGTPVSEDVLVFGEGRDKTEYYGLSVSWDGRWLVLTASPGTAPRNDAWIADLTAAPVASPRWQTIQEGVDAEVSPRVGRDGRLYLFTDRDAPRGRLCVADPTAPGYQDWRTLVATDPDAVLSDYAVVDGPDQEESALLVSWQRHAISEVSRHDLVSGSRLGAIALPGLGSVGGLVTRPEGGSEAWFGYTDNTTPSQVYRYDLRTDQVVAWRGPRTGLDLPEVRTEQVTYTSADGTQVRMLVMSPPGAEGPLPTVLYGYGGFSISLTPGYSASVLSWVRAGGVYAIANLRGGLEEGEEWHRGGMLANKQNVFDDCHAAAEHLIATGVTTADRLAVMGGSNGGLLVGAAVTQRPDLYTAAVCSAPLLDMVRYERFGLGQLWNVEYGSAEDPAALAWLLAYSPYHNVLEGTAYPATLFTVFDNDTRVDPLHARKMCAALQHATSAPRDRAPVLLRREAEVGHSSRSVSRSVRLSADQLSFLAHHTGLVIAGSAEPTV
ncbi:prolyl oligopeptidase family serine peptidase [Nocardiopsis ansamitocini]|uniref:prolyl oligopeptidase n=1 Tax=Nocardiopsis ansamitocini TaxID=1670832 RepID=A0A9W6UIQ0_9ACTN|nr:prolyl oligopeptidase family serine peptidase [Nocardiopsis ansamitocini]GLU47927.1 prolyl endopeptidase [Nocardiopsis ansamitocini]